MTLALIVLIAAGDAVEAAAALAGPAPLLAAGSPAEEALTPSLSFLLRFLEEDMTLPFWFGFAQSGSVNLISARIKKPMEESRFQQGGHSGGAPAVPIRQKVHYFIHTLFSHSLHQCPSGTYSFFVSSFFFF